MFVPEHAERKERVAGELAARRAVAVGYEPGEGSGCEGDTAAEAAAAEGCGGRRCHGKIEGVHSQTDVKGILFDVSMATQEVVVLQSRARDQDPA